MAMYTFYIWAGSGEVTSLAAFELGSDEYAPERALKMLQEHPRFAYVAVWKRGESDLPPPVLQSL